MRLYRFHGSVLTLLRHGCHSGLTLSSGVGTRNECAIWKLERNVSIIVRVSLSYLWIVCQQIIALVLSYMAGRRKSEYIHDIIGTAYLSSGGNKIQAKMFYGIKSG